MGDDVEFYVVIRYAIALFQLCLDVGPFFQDELVQALRALHIVPSPVVIELEAGKVLIPVVDCPARAQELIPIPANAKRAEDMDLRAHLNWQSKQDNPQAIQCTVRNNAVPKAIERGAFTHW